MLRTGIEPKALCSLERRNFEFDDRAVPLWPPTERRKTSFWNGQTCCICDCSAVCARAVLSEWRMRDLVALHLLQGARDTAPVRPITARNEHFGAYAKRACAASYNENLVSDVIAFVMFNIVSLLRTINPWTWVLWTDSLCINYVPFRFLCGFQFKLICLGSCMGALVLWSLGEQWCDLSCVDLNKCNGGGSRCSNVAQMQEFCPARQRLVFGCI